MSKTEMIVLLSMCGASMLLSALSYHLLDHIPDWICSAMRYLSFAILAVFWIGFIAISAFCS